MDGMGNGYEHAESSFWRVTTCSANYELPSSSIAGQAWKVTIAHTAMGSLPEEAVAIGPSESASARGTTVPWSAASAPLEERGQRPRRRPQ